MVWCVCVHVWCVFLPIFLSELFLDLFFVLPISLLEVQCIPKETFPFLTCFETNNKVLES